MLFCVFGHARFANLTCGGIYIRESSNSVMKINIDFTYKSDCKVLLQNWKHTNSKESTFPKCIDGPKMFPKLLMKRDRHTLHPHPNKFSSCRTWTKTFYWSKQKSHFCPPSLQLQVHRTKTGRLNCFGIWNRQKKPHECFSYGVEVQQENNYQLPFHNDYMQPKATSL